jgi:hypothetical protein
VRAFRLLDFRDHRNTELLERGRAIAQEAADQQLLAEYQRRVRRNPKELRRDKSVARSP